MDENGLLAALSQMSDEEFAQLLQASNVPNRNALISQEMQVAQGFGEPQSGPARTPLGGALGGLSDAVRGVSSAYQQKQLMGQMKGNLASLENPATGRLTLGMQGAQQSDEMAKQKALLELLRGGGAGDFTLPPGGV